MSAAIRVASGKTPAVRCGRVAAVTLVPGDRLAPVHGTAAPDAACTWTIRRLTISDAADYRRIRLRGLRECPVSFGSSYAEEAKRPLADFAERLVPTATKWVLGAFAGGRLVGVVTLWREERAKEHHKANMVGMYVDRAARRRGIGRGLLARALAVAEKFGDVKQVRLAVVESNHAAVRLYQQLGFAPYGREEDALRVAGRFYTELLLVRRLEDSRR